MLTEALRWLPIAGKIRGMDVRYALSFDSRDTADAAAARLIGPGLRISVDYHVYVDAPAASKDEVKAMREQLQLLADEFGGHFLGNGSFTRFAPDGEQTR